MLLRTGTARHSAMSIADQLLRRVGGLDGLRETAHPDLLRMAGLGAAKAATLCATRELAIRWATRPLPTGEPIGGPVDVHRHFIPRLEAERRESFHALLLDGRHRLIAVHEVSVGTLNASLVHPREVFREAIRRAAAGLVLVHNHPSGDPEPSAEDRAVTRRLVVAGRLVGIRVVDHVVVAHGGHFSFREAGQLGEDDVIEADATR